ncbi:hypothetical protein FHT40_000628 [Mycolicibacterium sp. BK556]|uniref:DUF4226 domain-containing protein n=1 Tax=Mycobacteriaceae TaxID=1762 RepID=UPI001061DFDA|nr:MULTISPECIES: DUF4226 domain-containing protein [Mycobacteriaceae]MBB3600995.1 hypothetical protein [Mycolicibacterium sp. BK556]MBB3630749.1 hypothetical protein [Mycolicibacterium sp. BK607]MBB3748745.1 hypothetical protein [Mycolicibacterium sp. BK634]TDO15064.1 uncharacterized protein DUF4226 [Mycobacterium sp. BK086]
MAEHVGAAGEALGAARTVLAARDRDLADADAELAEVVSSAHAAAAEAIRKLDAVHAEIESAVAQRAVTAPSEGREFARFLLAKQHEISDILTAARADADAKVAVLQQLQDRYQVPSTTA